MGEKLNGDRRTPSRVSQTTTTTKKRKKRGLTLTLHQRLGRNFLGETLEIQEQLFEFINYCVYPSDYTDSERLGIAVMVAGKGNGKTHFIDAISRVGEFGLFEWKKQQIENEMEVELATTSDSTRKQRIRRDFQSRFNELAFIEERYNNLLFFVPITFNSNIVLLEKELKAGPMAIVVCRMLFLYFANETCSIGEFFDLFQNIIKRINVRTALKIIQLDQIKLRSTLQSEFKGELRCVFLMDEIVRISQHVDGDGVPLHRCVYNIVRDQLFHGLSFPFLLHKNEFETKKRILTTQKQ